MSADILAFRPRAAATDALADCVPVALPPGIVPLRPPITREHRLQAALMIVAGSLEQIALALDIDATSWPTHIPPSVPEAIDRALRAIERVGP